jgi:hypothetical protein
MTKLVLVPLARFEVRFDLASGQSYGEVHRRILRAIGRRGASLEQLQEQFVLPARFLIESLINLFTEGWLTVTPDGFRLTPAGLKGTEDNGTPSFFQCATNEKTNVMMELVSGGLIRESAITYRSRGALQHSGDWDDSITMKSEFSSPVIDRAQVKPFIFHGKDQWIRNVTDAVVSSGEWHWLPVDVNLESGVLAGLPSAWEPTLKPAILDLMQNRPDLGSERKEQYWKGSALRTKPQPLAKQLARFRKEDLLFSALDHRDELLRLLSHESGRILVASTAGGALSSELQQAFAKFSGKGGKLDLFAATVSERDIGAEISELTGCGANLVLHLGDNGGTGIIGSFPWLGRMDVDKNDLSIVVRHPEIVGSLFETAASLLERSGAAGPFSDAIDFWRNGAAKLYDKFAQDRASQEVGESDELSEIRLIRDQLHYQEAADLILTAQSRCLVASAVAEARRAIRVVSPLTRRAHSALVETKIIAGTVNVGAKEIQEIDAILAPYGTRLRGDSKSGVNTVVSDTSVLISSHQFLAGSRTRTAEIGLLVDGGEVARWVWERLSPEID